MLHPFRQLLLRLFEKCKKYQTRVDLKVKTKLIIIFSHKNIDIGRNCLKRYNYADSINKTHCIFKVVQRKSLEKLYIHE